MNYKNTVIWQACRRLYIIMVETYMECSQKAYIKISQRRWKEKKKKYGNLYPDKCFYVIRLRETPSSIGANMPWVLKQLIYANENKMIPVVDFSFFKNVYLTRKEIGKINPWMYFFEQPSHYGLDAVYHAKNVILSNANNALTVDEWDKIILDDEVLIQKYNDIAYKYIHVNSRLEKKAKIIFDKLFGNTGKKPRVLAVTYRGTDYRNRKVVGEHKQPSLEQELIDAERFLKEWNCDFVYISTEDGGAVEAFEKRFDDKVRYMERKRYSSDVVSTAFSQLYEDDNNEYQKGEDYLIDMCLCAKCDCLLSGRFGMLGFVLPFNNGRYEHKHIYNLGKYTEADYDYSFPTNS